MTRAASTGDGAEVVVVGAGVIGASIAWRLGQRGVDVLLIDPEPGRGASWAAAGMLAPVTEAHFGEERLLALNLASQRRWPGFAAELAAVTGRDPGYRETGTVSVARDRDDRAALDRVAAYQSGLGLTVERLTSRELRRLEPGLAPGVVGGILAAGDHQVDNRALVTALLEACGRVGVRSLVAAVDEVQAPGDVVAGVRISGGRHVAADTVVVASGYAAAQLGGLAPGTIPVRPVKGQLLHLRGPREHALAQRVVRGLDVYIVPRHDGRLVVGATVEERGADTTVTAGAVLELLRAAYELLPGITELEITELSAGLRPGTPDNAPLLGRSAVEGLVVATGHFRNGILLTPITADAIAELIVDGTLADVIAPFAPTRTRPPRTVTA